jgi:hypothetical protein
MSIPGIILCAGLGEADGAAAGICVPGCISCDGFGEADGAAAGICVPGCISCDGTAAGDGDVTGICIPGCISCDGIADGDGDVAGICIPGCISCDGLGAELGLFIRGFLVAARRILGRDFFFFGAVFGFGLLIPGILLMSCPSCCGNALTLNAKTKASAPSAHELKSINCFMIFPCFGKANPDSVLEKNRGSQATRQNACATNQDEDCLEGLNAEDIDEDMPGSCLSWRSMCS